MQNTLYTTQACAIAMVALFMTSRLLTLELIFLSITTLLWYLHWRAITSLQVNT